MMKSFILYAVVVTVLAACNKKVNDAPQEVESITEQAVIAETIINTDTLQFIHFEDNFDYWYAVFLNSKKDTVNLVTDSIVPAGLKNKLVEVQWFTDTLSEAGDNESKYAAKRMHAFKEITGEPFVAALSEAQIINDVKNIPEVKGGADEVRIADRPRDGKNYYLIETGTRGEDNFSRFWTVRVYIYPKYDMRIYDAASETEYTIQEWKKRNE
ncbi:MAG: hypothetical protein EOO45_22670 [Flavobacterium sp.]|nr:MAG: hypothetical protein EOO45_22670 [Flavobacterium sp.]